MNKKGIVFFYTLMLGTIIIVLGLALAQPIQSFVDDSRTNVGCNAPSSMYDEALCYGLDLLKPLVTGGIILIGFAVIAARTFIGG